MTELVYIFKKVTSFIINFSKVKMRFYYLSLLLKRGKTFYLLLSATHSLAS